MSSFTEDNHSWCVKAPIHAILVSFDFDVLQIRPKLKSTTFGRTMTPYIHKFTCDSDDCIRLSLHVWGRVLAVIGPAHAS